MLYKIYLCVYIHIYLSIFLVLSKYYCIICMLTLMEWFFMCILIYIIMCMLLSATSTHFKWELMLYYLQSPTLNKNPYSYSLYICRHHLDFILWCTSKNICSYKCIYNLCLYTRCVTTICTNMQSKLTEKLYGYMKKSITHPLYCQWRWWWSHYPIMWLIPNVISIY